jgi:hypothetical protein
VLTCLPRTNVCSSSVANRVGRTYQESSWSRESLSTALRLDSSFVSLPSLSDRSSVISSASIVRQRLIAPPSSATAMIDSIVYGLSARVLREKLRASMPDGPLEISLNF